jgi:hypothetical protein
VGLVLALFGMRPGSPVVPLPERMEYLAGHPAGWTWGWGVWMVCSLLLLAYVAALRNRAPTFGADLALTLTAAGMGVDLMCDVVQIRALPLATASEPLFLSLEALVFTGGATVANGLYTAAVLIFTLTLRIGHWARLAGFATVVFGTAMAVAGMIPSPRLLELATGPTIGFYSLWTILVARDFR